VDGPKRATAPGHLGAGTGQSRTRHGPGSCLGSEAGEGLTVGGGRCVRHVRRRRRAGTATSTWGRRYRVRDCGRFLS